MESLYSITVSRVPFGGRLVRQCDGLRSAPPPLTHVVDINIRSKCKFMLLLQRRYVTNSSDKHVLQCFIVLSLAAPTLTPAAEAESTHTNGTFNYFTMGGARGMAGRLPPCVLLPAPAGCPPLVRIMTRCPTGFFNFFL